MPTFKCLDGGNHDLSASVVETGIAVTLDGRTKTIEIPPYTPSAELLGNTMLFSDHEHCIRDARHAVEEMFRKING